MAEVELVELAGLELFQSSGCHRGPGRGGARRRGLGAVCGSRLVRLASDREECEKRGESGFKGHDQASRE